MPPIRSERGQGASRPTLFSPASAGLNEFTKSDALPVEAVVVAKNIRTQRGDMATRPGRQRVTEFARGEDTNGAVTFGAGIYGHVAAYAEEHAFGPGAWAIFGQVTAVRPAGNPANHAGVVIYQREILDGSHKASYGLQLKADGTLRGFFSTHASAGATVHEVTTATTANAQIRTLLLWDPVTGGGRLELYLNGDLAANTVVNADVRPYDNAAARLLVTAGASAALPGGYEADTAFGGKVDALAGLWFPGADPNYTPAGGRSLKDTLRRFHRQTWPNPYECAFHYPLDGATAALIARDMSLYRNHLTIVGAPTPAARLALASAPGNFIGEFSGGGGQEEVLVIVGGDSFFQRTRAAL